MASKLITITGEELLRAELPPTRMVVHRLLPQGLHILAGAPKTGKSWLTLWLCLQVAKGESVWDLSAEKGTVLYLCLEDSLGRIQERTLDLTDDAPPDIHFATMAESINGGLVKQIERFLSEHTDTNLIAIDTLQRVRNPSGELNAYANDYKDIHALKTVADKHGIAILLVHHLRKQCDDDPVNMISGTTGLTGAVDGIYVLKRESRQSSKARLIATGRDIEDTEYTLAFHKDSCRWTFLSDDSEQPFSLSADQDFSETLALVKREGVFTGTASELSAEIHTGTRPNILSKKLLQHRSVLSEWGVTVAQSRTGTKRVLTLRYEPPSDDGNDGNDGKNDTDPVSDLLSQPSLPSQPEQGFRLEPTDTAG